MDPIRRMRLIIDSCPDSWLAECFRRYIDGAHKGLSMEEAFGLHVSRGKSVWWRRERLRARDTYIEVLASVCCPKRSINAQAKAVYHLADHYEATAWKRDRYRDAMPTRYTRTFREILYHTFRLAKEARTKFPKERQIRKILAKQRPVLRAQPVGDN